MVHQKQLQDLASEVESIQTTLDRKIATVGVSMDQKIADQDRKLTDLAVMVQQLLDRPALAPATVPIELSTGLLHLTVKELEDVVVKGKCVESPLPTIPRENRPLDARERDLESA